uniref:Uncharacterized protein n=1 Tax=Parascaris univalens TaxID=6257 RepID=A0A915B1Y1_PARUN
MGTGAGGESVPKMLQSIPNFRILIYNGDLDTVCDFLGDAWHVSALAKQLHMQSTNRVQWSFRNQLAGFVQRYYNNRTAIDVLTVKVGSRKSFEEEKIDEAREYLNFIAF